jgi:hypothetical protein
MSGNQVSITNVINISVAQAQAGIGDYNTSNLALFTAEVFDPTGFGTLGYKIYLSPQEVGEDFGTTSQTYSMAVSIFSQKPNILAGNGYLVIIPFIAEVQHLAFDHTPDTGTFVLNFGGNATAAINYNDTASIVQSKVQAVLGLEAATVTGTINSGTGLTINFKGYYGNAALMTVTSNSLMEGGSVAVNVTITQVTAGETLVDSIVRTQGLVQYFGLMATLLLGQVDILAAGATVQTLNKIAFFVSNKEATVAPGGLLDLLRTGGLTQSRGLFYGSPSSDSAALNMQAAYAGRALSTNFSGSNTTATMHLKDLSGIQPDPLMNQTLLNLCQAAGADVYISIQGVPKVFCSGTNSFFDQVYNLQWFVGALQVAGFNYLATSATKIPQTENGIDGLKNAYRQICEQAVTNQYSAPGTWNSSTTFGNQQDFLQNIQQRGYYIYSQPIAKQSQTDRAARKAPLIQLALKEAGAVHSSAVIVYVNA